MATVDYRERIYTNYASGFMDAKPVFDTAAASRWAKAYDYYFRGWLPQCKEEPIVDLACGGGRLLHFFRQRGYTEVRGVDISPEQIRLARQVTPHVVEQNVLDFLEQHRGEFGLITGLDIIEHFSKSEVLRFLDLCQKALKPRGRLVLQTPNAETPWGTYHRYNDFTHETCFQPNSLRNLLRLCGFSGYEHREMGPVPWGYSLVSSLRHLIWRTIRLGLQLYNVAETGSPGSGTFTRVFLVSATKP